MVIFVRGNSVANRQSSHFETDWEQVLSLSSSLARRAFIGIFSILSPMRASFPRVHFFHNESQPLDKKK